MNARLPSFAVGLGCGLVVPFIWGGWIVASRFGVLNALTPFDVTAIRVGVAAIIVLPLLLTRGLAGLPLWKGAVLSFGVGVPFALTSFGGMALAPVVHAGVLTNGVMPIFAAIIGYYWLRELPARSQIGGMLLIVVGAAMMSGAPAVAVLIAIPALGEIPSTISIIGVVVVTAGILVALGPGLLSGVASPAVAKSKP